MYLNIKKSVSKRAMQQTMLQLAQDTCTTASTYPIAQVYMNIYVCSLLRFTPTATLEHSHALPWCTVFCHQLQLSCHALLVHTHTHTPSQLCTHPPPQLCTHPPPQLYSGEYFILHLGQHGLLSQTISARIQSQDGTNN